MPLYMAHVFLIPCLVSQARAFEFSVRFHRTPAQSDHLILSVNLRRFIFVQKVLP